MVDSKPKNLRVEYGRNLAESGWKYPEIIVLEGDLKESTQSIQFQELFHERFFEMGIAEQNMVGVAAGLARSGKIPVVHSFASFISMKACEQVRTNIAFQKLNVKLVVSHAGVSAGSAGTTHHSIEDIAIMRSMPNMTVMVPGDALDIKNCFSRALQIKGPVYLRISASDAHDILDPVKHNSYDSMYQVREGSDIAIFTTGITLQTGKDLSDLLSERSNIKVQHIHMSTVKPIDKEVVNRYTGKFKWLFSIEEHNVIGGLGGAIAEVVAEQGTSRLVRFGIKDHYCSPGTQQYILEKEGLTAESLYNEVYRRLSS